MNTLGGDRFLRVEKWLTDNVLRYSVKAKETHMANATKRREPILPKSVLLP